MAKGFGIEVSDLLVAGAVAFVAYSVYKTAVAPASRITDAIADVVTSPTEILEDAQQKYTTGWLIDTPRRLMLWMAGKGVLW